MNPVWNEKWSEIQRKVDTLSIRERSLILITALILLYFIWYTFLFGYLLASEQQTQDTARRLADQLSLLQGQFDAVQTAIGRDPTSMLNKQLQELKSKHAELDQKIIAQSEIMASPKDMVQIIKQIIDNSEGLTLINLSNLATLPLFPNKNKKLPIEIYTHGIQLELSGNYFNTLRFLEKIEKQPYKILWDSLSYEVKKYPNANVKISIRTLGLEEGWIGV